MKHEALTRVFAAVLAVFAVVLIIAGIYGIGNALGDRKENKRVYDVMASRTAEYEEITNRLAEEDSYEKVMNELDRQQAEHEKNKAAHQMSLATYSATRGALKEGQEAMSEAMGGMSMDSMFSSAGFSGMGDSLKAYATDVTLNAYAGIDVAMQNYEAALIAFTQNPDSEELKANLQYANAELEIAENSVRANLQADANAMVGQAMNTVSSMVSGLMQLETAKEMMQEMKLQVIRDSVNLAVAKADLDRENDELAALQARADSIRADERRLTVLKVNLSSNENIKQTLTRSSDVISAAKNEMTRFGKEYRSVFLKTLLINVLMILAAVAAILGMPAAYGKTDKRMFLLAPVLVYTVFCAAAEVLNLLFFKEQQYPALFAALFGIVQLFIIIPQEKEEPEED